MKLGGQSLETLRSDLPPSVRVLQLGGLLNSFGNGLVLPFLLIYLHNVRGISLGVAGLIVGTNAGMSLVAGPIWGPLVDRHGPRRVLRLALLVLAVGYGSLALVDSAWEGFAAAAIAGVGNGGFWPAQSTLLAGLSEPWQRPSVYAVQRITMNLGIGLGGVVGGLVATTSDPATFQALFLGDAATFLLYCVALSRVPELPPVHHSERPAGGFGLVLRDHAFMAVVGLNLVLISAGLSQIDVLPAYMKNFAGVGEFGISLVFAANTAVIVIAQLPIARSQRGRRRMRTQAGVGICWGVCWCLVPVVAIASGSTATVGFMLVAGLLGVGECLHGSVQAPLVADLADERLMGRYMAASAFSWSAGFAIGPAVGGIMLAHAPTALWEAAALVCVAAGCAGLALERLIPHHARHTPTTTAAAGE
jgi:MFS family permease